MGRHVGDSQRVAPRLYPRVGGWPRLPQGVTSTENMWAPPHSPGMQLGALGKPSELALGPCHLHSLPWTGPRGFSEQPHLRVALPSQESELASRTDGARGGLRRTLAADPSLRRRSPPVRQAPPPGASPRTWHRGIASYRCGPRCRAVEQLFPAAGLSPKPSWA